MLIALVMFFVGIVGTILPAVPGAPLLWLGMLIYGLFIGFAKFHWSFFLGQALLVIAVELVDHFATAVGVSRSGGSRMAVWAAIVGGFAGLWLMGPLGLLAGAFVLVILAELAQGRTFSMAWRSAVGSLVGMVKGLLAKFLLEAVMLIWFFRTAF